MNENIFIIIFIIILIIFYFINYSNTRFIRSQLDNNIYQIQDNDNYMISLKYLSLLKNNCIKLVNNLDIKNVLYEKYKKRFIRLKNKINNIPFQENDINEDSTSYTINKGDKIVLCLRSKKSNNHHDLNMIMYILIHELAHIICHEIGHSKLFYKINKFLLQEAIKLNIYKNINYKEYPREYCGIELNEYLL